MTADFSDSADETPFLRSVLPALNPNPARPIGLVVEGGGCRGIYAAGVLDVLYAEQLPVGGLAGVSAGAIHGASFVSGQPGRSIRFYERFCRDERFFSVRRWLRTGNLIDPDFCYREIPEKLDPFDGETFRNSPVRFVAAASNLETGRCEYLHIPDLTTEIDGLRASASLPYVSPVVEFRGMKLLDGGCTDRVPLAAFEAMGFARNIVILTHPREHRVRDFDAAAARFVYRRYPKFVRAFEESGRVYEAAQALVEKRSKEGRAFVIRPARPIGIPRLTHKPEDIRRAYELGRRDATARLPAMRAWASSFV